MKRREDKLDDLLHRHMDSSRTWGPKLSDGSRERILKAIVSGKDAASGEEKPVSESFRGRWRLAMAIAAVAGVLLSFLFVRSLVAPDNVYAIVESVEGPLYRIDEGKPLAISVGARINAGTPVRTDSAGAVLKLRDGGQIEMHAKSELSLESAEDGTRIRLNTGSVSVTPSKEPTGILYVQNREGTVPVVGTTFRSASAPIVPAAQTPQEPRIAFEVASIRPSSPIPSGVGGRGGGPGDGSANFRPGERGCVPASSKQVDPRRLVINRATLIMLVGYAYPDQLFRDASDIDDCVVRGSLGLLSGGPGWVKTDMWDIEAVIPEGSFGVPLKFADPKLQRMLQTLLAERFKVVVRRETREMPVYLMKVGKNGPRFNKPTRPINWFLNGADGKPKRVSELTPEDGGGFFGTPRWQAAYNVTMAEWAHGLFADAGRPVFDRTGLNGKYTFYFEYPGSVVGYDHPIRLDTTKEIGLDLEESKAPLDVWVIDRAEKPSEN